MGIQKEWSTFPCKSHLVNVWITYFPATLKQNYSKQIRTHYTVEVQVEQPQFPWKVLQKQQIWLAPKTSNLTYHAKIHPQTLRSNTISAIFYVNFLRPKSFMCNVFAPIQCFLIRTMGPHFKWPPKYGVSMCWNLLPVEAVGRVSLVSFDSPRLPDVDVADESARIIGWWGW